jgi:hypothetical protein
MEKMWITSILSPREEALIRETYELCQQVQTDLLQEKGTPSQTKHHTEKDGGQSNHG